MKHLLLLVIGVCLVAPSWAKTPDGETPAEERVCDQLKTGTPGLYGLCVSFCEARDLDRALATGRPSAKQLEKLAAKKQAVLARYDAKKGADDPGMPCIQNAACPCWGAEQTSKSFWNSRTAAPKCTALDQPASQFDYLTAGSGGNGDLTSVMSVRNQQGLAPFNLCWHQDQKTGTSMTQLVDDSDAQVCATQVRSTCDVLGK